MQRLLFASKWGDWGLAQIFFLATVSLGSSRFHDHTWHLYILLTAFPQGLSQNMTAPPSTPSNGPTLALPTSTKLSL